MKMTIGSKMPASKTLIQMMRGAIIQVLSPLMVSPSVKIAVRTRPTNVVTSAIPPLSAGRYRNAILMTNGSNSISTPLNALTISLRGNKTRKQKAHENAHVLHRNAYFMIGV